MVIDGDVSSVKIFNEFNTLDMRQTFGKLNSHMWPTAVKIEFSNCLKISCRGRNAKKGGRK